MEDVIILTPAQRRAIHALNQSDTDNRRMEPFELETGEWVVRKEQLIDPVWRRYRAVIRAGVALRIDPREILRKSGLDMTAEQRLAHKRRYRGDEVSAEETKATEDRKAGRTRRTFTP